MSEQNETNDGVDDVFDGGPGMDWDNNEKLREEKMQTNEKRGVRHRQPIVRQLVP